jgi:hypothetical protein
LGWLRQQTHYSKLLLTLSLDITNSVKTHFIVCGGCLTLINMSCHDIQGTLRLKCLLSFSNKITAVQILQDKDLKQGSSGNSGPTLGSHLVSPSFPEQPPSWSLLYTRTTRWWQPTDLEKWKKKTEHYLRWKLRGETFASFAHQTLNGYLFFWWANCIYEWELKN